ncbi:hypothetical protein DIE11_17685 [Burkholderia sp. Bp9012]|uniref:hypothetical protein n=1 Tax=Burkholderia sp. Bp9012 TaxID=2184562 RepID=UPI000F595DEC|nr:hypothetical protein [Burkholderia sp. Bp9012]RQR79220.1 hypothetical protein DIE11_17685 [Burkholderia sp. Bp9012]
MFTLRSSRWTYANDSTTGSLGLEDFVASGGALPLKDPSGKVEHFYYGGIGVGLSARLKIPKVPSIKLPTFLPQKTTLSETYSDPSFAGGGCVFMTAAFPGSELKKSDIQGTTLFIDVGGSAMSVGASADIMLLGINTAQLMTGATMQDAALVDEAIRNAPAVLMLWGLNAGLQPDVLSSGALRAGLGDGAGVLLGYLH